VPPVAVDENRLLAHLLLGRDARGTEPARERYKGVVTGINTDGTATVTKGADPTPITGVRSDSNYVPAVGDYVDLEIADGDTTVLGMLGNSPSVFSGLLTSTVATSESTTVTAYGDLTTVGPYVTAVVGGSGRALVVASASITTPSNPDGAAMSVAVSGASTVAAAAGSRELFTDGTHSGSRLILFAGLTPGTTVFTAKYRSQTSGSTGTFADRVLLVLPL
jgi:hypothetical protein